MQWSEINQLKKPVHLAIGMFDGIHLGHRAVIESALELARRSQGISAVLTFHPHPSAFLHPESPTQLILSPENKRRLILEMGVDAVLVQEFNNEFAAIEAEAFPHWLLRQLPHLKSVSVGENFRFGKGRVGDVDLLLRECRKLGLHVHCAARIREDGKRISSTRIRESLRAGDFEAANLLLGYCYSYRGKIVPGRQLGQALGFSTINIPWGAELQPHYGVYAVKARRTVDGDSDWRCGVANFGVRPSVDLARDQPLLEVHLFDSVTWQPGEECEVRWHRFLRPEKKFDSLDALKAQIAKDCQSAKAYFGE